MRTSTGDKEGNKMEQKWTSVKDRLPKHMEKVLAVVNGKRIVTNIVYGLSLDDRAKMQVGKIPCEMCGGYSGDPLVYSEVPRWKQYQYGDQDKFTNPDKAYKWETGSDATHWMPLPAFPMK